VGGEREKELLPHNVEHGSSAALQLQQQVIVDQLAADLVVGERVIGESIQGSHLTAER